MNFVIERVRPVPRREWKNNLHLVLRLFPGLSKRVSVNSVASRGFLYEGAES